MPTGLKVRFTDSFGLSGYVERLRRSRWQCLSMALLILGLRIQHQLSPTIGVLVATQFLILLTLPVQPSGKGRKPGGVGARRRSSGFASFN